MRVRMLVTLLGTINGIDGLNAGTEHDLPDDEAVRMAHIGQLEFLDEPTPTSRQHRVPIYSPHNWPAWRESA